MTGWLTATLPLLHDPSARERSHRLARWSLRALDSIRHSLASGQPVPAPVSPETTP
jgi:hypothetical protein